MNAESQRRSRQRQTPEQREIRRNNEYRYLYRIKQSEIIRNEVMNFNENGVSKHYCALSYILKRKGNF